MFIMHTALVLVKGRSKQTNQQDTLQPPDSIQCNILKHPNVLILRCNGRRQLAAGGLFARGKLAEVLFAC